ncbi:DUF6538 domain-containing protein [Rhodomicrobium lacus]|uniref:DUF6538 domain-containing protein n=1 Tax=Rhodomicrobium lacus TaxID=2498452 RepID=UPI0026E194E6|nr:DUF6538 domain-containing protein [Rhodomicrobium lacus]WKW50727.1 site-specific integrase [Rhodomicrobium lacus]
MVFKLPDPGKDDLLVSATLGSEVTFSLRTREPALAKLRHAAASVQLEQHFQALRNGPRWLSHKERVALGGLAYDEFVKSFEDFPGEPEIWELAREAHESALSSSERSEAWFGPYVDQLALAKGLVLDPESRRGAIQEAGRALVDVAKRLHRNASGDYSPDPAEARFPRWEDAKPSVSIHDVFERWQRERKPSASTISTWRGCVDGFVAHLGHNDMSRVTKKDVVAWKDALIARGLAPQTVNDGHLTALKALYRYALDNDLVTTNPLDGLRVIVKKRAGTGMLPHTDQDVARILSLSKLETLPYRRWMPWLLAFSGARVGEIAQLWGCRIKVIDGIPTMHIAPAEDGGSLKNVDSERTIPIHPAIVDQGFMNFVRERGEGPLFYQRRGSGEKHPSKGVSNHLAAWIRSEGFTEKRQAPNHAFRHWFKSACMREGILDSLADAIQGHKGGEADRYRHGHLRTMLEAISKLKVEGLKPAG